MKTTDNEMADSTKLAMATLVSFTHDMIRNLRTVMVRDRPSANAREFKQFGRILKDYADGYDKLVTYYLNETDRLLITESKQHLEEDLGNTMTFMYFNIRNEVINTELPEDTIDSIVHMRILELMLKVIDRQLFKLGMTLDKKYTYLLGCLQAFCSGWEDNGGHQERCAKIIQINVDKIMAA